MLFSVSLPVKVFIVYLFSQTFQKIKTKCWTNVLNTDLHYLSKCSTHLNCIINYNLSTYFKETKCKKKNLNNIIWLQLFKPVFG